MSIKRLCTTLAILLMGAATALSQEKYTETSFYFRVRDVELDPDYRSNGESLRRMLNFLSEVQQDSTTTIKSVTFYGSASPEGSDALNHRLSVERLAALESIVRNEISLPDSIITREYDRIPLELLEDWMKEGGMIEGYEEVFSIIAEAPELVEYRRGAYIDRRILKLQKLDGGKTWKMLSDKYFHDMRTAYVVFVTFSRVSAIPASDTLTDSLVSDSSSDNALAPREGEPGDYFWRLPITLKTNAIGWGLGMINGAVEFDLTDHMSIALPLYWSAWNYFTPTLKFRAFAFQPELRYYFGDNYDSWFAGAHFGMAWYNVALNGEYRYQDHDGEAPALGGGLAVGYRLPLTRNGRLNLEFSLGVGVYKLHYDRFRNETNGLLVDTNEKTAFGIDQASVSLTYTLGKKGGRK